MTTSSKFCLLATAGLLAAVSTPRTLLAQGPTYNIESIGTLSQNQPDDSAATGINNHSYVVGSSLVTTGSGATGIRAVRRTPAALVQLAPVIGWANKMNDFGDVVGAKDSGPGMRACMWDINGASMMIHVGSLDNSEAMDINTYGEVVGVYDYAAASPVNERRGFFRDAAGNLEYMGTFSGAESAAVAVNVLSVGTGWVNNSIGDRIAVRWDTDATNPVLSALFTGGQDSWGTDINIDGSIVGSLDDGVNPVSGFLYWFGTPITLPTPYPTEDTFPVAVNSFDWAVGNTSNGTSNHCLVWKDNQNVFDLQTLLPAGSGWTLEEVTDINDLGEITGWGYYNGNKRGFRMTPDVALPVYGGIQPALAKSNNSAFHGDGFTPGGTVHIVWSTQYGNDTYMGVSTDLNNPQLLVATTADSNGRVYLPHNLHNSFYNQTMMSHAIDLSASVASKRRTQIIHAR